MTGGKYRQKKDRKREADSARLPIMNPSGQEPNPESVTDPRSKTPTDTKPKRPPSTWGEIVMSIFVGATVVIYIILTCMSVQTLKVDQRAWVGITLEGTKFVLGEPMGFN